MKNLKLAIRAFWTILIKGNHIYCDNSKVSLSGKPREIHHYCSAVLECATDELKQNIIVIEAKQLIKQK